MLELNTLYNMDCMEGMAAFPDKYFELAIVDPPYGIGCDGKFGIKKGDKERWPLSQTRAFKDVVPPPEYFTELFRVSKNQIIWGANHFISLIPFDSPCWVVWNKCKPPGLSFAGAELAWTSFKRTAVLFDFIWNGYLQGQANNGRKSEGNHKRKEKRIHPTQKPVVLYSFLLNIFAKPGDKILDTHAGSASSLIAAHNAGYEYIGFEIDEVFFRDALNRLNDVKRQVALNESTSA